MSTESNLSQASSADMSDYGVGHAPRYDALEKLIADLRLPASAKVLDVGSSFFTLRLIQMFQDVSTMGFSDARDLICKIPESIPHFSFDLNNSREPKKWIDLPKFDLIVFAEVVEHLPTAPQQVFRFLASGLARSGLLVVQTPNATSLDKRLKMLSGTNPYELIREDWTNPGYFREYTKAELVSMAKDAGLELVRHEYRSYFKSPRLAMKFIDLLVVPFPFLRRGQTAVFRLQSK